MIGFPYNGNSKFRVGDGAPNMSEAPENTDVLITKTEVGKSWLARGREVTDLRWIMSGLFDTSTSMAQFPTREVGWPRGSAYNIEVELAIDSSLF
jgi:hypothetical protein